MPGLLRVGVYNALGLIPGHTLFPDKKPFIQAKFLSLWADNPKQSAAKETAFRYPN